MKPTRARVLRCDIGRASRNTRPPLGWHKPRRILSRVVLPARLGPRSASTSPGSIPRLTPRKAWIIRPRCIGVRYVFTTSTNSAVKVCILLNQCDLHTAFQNRDKRIDHVRRHLRVCTRNDLTGRQRSGGTALGPGVVLHRLQGRERPTGVRALEHGTKAKGVEPEGVPRRAVIGYEMPFSDGPFPLTGHSAPWS